MSRIEGIFVPTIAPYTPSGKLNRSELARIVDWLVEKGVSGLYPNGSLGEFIRLSFEERKEVISIVCEAARGRVPVLAGAAEANIDLTLEMARHCAELGCRAVSITGPYYYKLSQESIEEYFRELAAFCPIDIIIYNIPMFANEISLPVLQRLALECPRIIGTKDSSKDLCRFMRVIHAVNSQRPDFVNLIGWEDLLVPSMMMGGDGGTLSTTGVAPEVMMKIYDTAKSGDWDSARRMQYQIMDIFQAMLDTPNFPEGFRAGYEIRGFDVGRARFPNSREEMRRFETMRGKIACLLADFGFEEAAAVCRTSARNNPPAPIQADVERIVREIVTRFKP